MGCLGFCCLRCWNLGLEKVEDLEEEDEVCLEYLSGDLVERCHGLAGLHFVKGLEEMPRDLEALIFLSHDAAQSLCQH